MPAPRSALSRRTTVGYAVGSIGTGGFGTLPGLVLVYYLTDSLGVTALLAGLVVTAAKVWDVVIDPVIGARSDADLARTGSRRRFMVIGALSLPVLFALTFVVPPGTEQWIAALWVFVAFVLTTTAFSLFQVPYIALPAELTSGYHARTRLLAARVVVLTFAILLFGAGGPELRALGQSLGDESTGYLLMAVVAGVVMGVGLLVAASVAPRTPPGASAAVPRVSLAGNYRAGWAVLRRSQPFRALLATFVLQGLATGLMLAGAQYVATYVLGSERALTLLFVALIAPALLFTPVWAAIAGRVGKERAFAWASGLFAVAALALVPLLWAPGEWLYLPVGLVGAAYAGMQALPMAMLPDVISNDATAHGAGSAGVFGGVWTAGETAGMAFGATVLTIALALTGYVESVGDQVVTQPASAVAGIVVSFSVVPAAIVIVSLLTLVRYRLRKSDIEQTEAVAA